MGHIRLLAFVLPLLASCGSSAASVTSSRPSTPPSLDPVQVAAAPTASGIWLGTLHVGTDLRMQFRIDANVHPPSGTLDSLDEQDGAGIPCANIAMTGRLLSFDVPAIYTHLKATLSADGTTLNGTWSQRGSEFPLVLHRQASPLSPAKQVFDPTLPPVAIADLRKVLDSDLATTLTTGDLDPATGSGVTLGVVSHGERIILSYGGAKVDSVFEIRSITKTFTGLLLAQMFVQKKVTLYEPVRALLPPGVVSPPASGPEISLLDLSTQRSGMPRMPDNFAPADPTNPYADYDVAALYAFVSKHGVGRPEHPEPLYSNLGVGLLGQALAERAHSTYASLLERDVTGVLGMHDTGIALTPSMRARFLPGHDPDHKPTHEWDFAALAGTGGLRSTAADMLVYLDAQLRPEHLPVSARSQAAGRTLPAALALSHELRGDFTPPGTRIALNWMYTTKSKMFWHDGGTRGFSSYASFNPNEDFAVVVLLNTDPDATGLADRLGRHVEARLQGRPARSLGPR